MAYLDHKQAQDITAEALAALGAPSLVYVREISLDDLSKDLQGEYGPDAEVEIEPGTRLFAVHAANGTRMAVVDSREAAFMAAREYEMTPVSVH